MEPLISFVASIVGSLVVDALQSEGDVEEFYPKVGETFRPYTGWISMRGRNVTWWVEPGEAVWIDADMLRPIEGNIFDPDKLGAVARAVRDSTRPVDLYAGYGQVRRVTPDLVAESIRYAPYSTGRPFTTGDSRLDRWLVDREEPDHDDSEDEYLEEALARAVLRGSGDLGRWTATVRDGNHRAFGAILGGERRVAVRLYDNDAQQIREDYRVARLAGDGETLLAKMIEDTGASPGWLDRR